MKKLISLLLFLGLIGFVLYRIPLFGFDVWFDQQWEKYGPKTTGLNNKLLIISSPDFSNNYPIPPQYTCDGSNFSPNLEFKAVPALAQSLVLIVDDIDAAKENYVHWVVFNIPPTTSTFPAGKIPDGIVEANNTIGHNYYDGPCPPAGETHRYRFKLYAIDIKLKDLNYGATKVTVERAIEGHILDEAQLIGVYTKQ